MTTFKHVFAICSLATSISGCAVFDYGGRAPSEHDSKWNGLKIGAFGPDSFVAFRPYECTASVSEDPKVRLETQQDCAQKQGVNYGRRAAQLVNEDTWLFDMPIMGAALAGLSTIFYGSHPDTTFGVGAIGASLGGLKAYANVNSAAGFYEWGEGVCNCVSSAAIDMQVHWPLVNSLSAEYGDNTGEHSLQKLTIKAVDFLDDDKKRSNTDPTAIAALTVAAEGGAEALSLTKSAIARAQTTPKKAAQTLANVDAKLRRELRTRRPALEELTKAMQTKLAEVNDAVTKSAKGSSTAERVRLFAEQITPESPPVDPGDDDAELVKKYSDELTAFKEREENTEKAKILAKELATKIKTVSEHAATLIEHAASIPACIAEANIDAG